MTLSFASKTKWGVLRSFALLTLSVGVGAGAGCTPADDGQPSPGGGGSGGGASGKGGSGGQGQTPGTGGGAPSGSGGQPGSGGGGPTGSGGGGASDGPAGETGGGGSGGSGGSPSAGTQAKMIKLDTTATGANVTGDVPKYPVAVILTAANFDFATAKPKGEDLRFATAEGAALPHAIDQWDAVAKTAAIWVKVDVKGNSTQTIKMTWGDPSAADGSKPEVVFDTKEGFTGVWHLGEAPGTTADGYKDATTNAAHGTGVALTDTSSGEGRIGKAVLLENAKRQWVGIGLEKSKLYDKPEKMTYSLWAYAKTHTVSYQCHFSKGEKGFRLHYFGNSTIVETCLEHPTMNDLCPVKNNGAKVVPGQWFHLTGVHDFPKHGIYVNGVLDAMFTSAGPWISDPTKPVMIGNNASNTARAFDGFLDEARLMDVAKDEHWIKLEFESQKEGQKFLTVM
jgi:hypothetical protein